MIISFCVLKVSNGEFDYLKQNLIDYARPT